MSNETEIARIGGRLAMRVDCEPIVRAAPFRDKSRVSISIKAEHPEKPGELAMMGANLGEQAARMLYDRLWLCIEKCWGADRDATLEAREQADRNE
jgi:hypothetical protein